jgi:hypothetical protein
MARKIRRERKSVSVAVLHFVGVVDLHQPVGTKMVYPAVASARFKCHPRLIGVMTESVRVTAMARCYPGDL